MSEDSTSRASGEQGQSSGDGSTEQRTAGGDSELAKALSAINRRLDNFDSEFASLRNFREQMKRHQSKDEAKSSEQKEGEKLTDEQKLLRDLQKKVAEADAREQHRTMTKALETEVDALDGIADGAGKLIAEMISPYLKHHDGKVYVDKDDRLTPVSEAVAELSKNPHFRAPKTRSGSGEAGNVARVTGPGGKKLDFDSMTKEDRANYRARVMSGEIGSFGESS